jgi:hypothetical protein
MSDIDFDEAMKQCFGKENIVYIDENTDFNSLPNPFRQMHPTLKACACGFVGNKYELEKHFAGESTSGQSPREFWTQHGEIPFYE